MKKTISILFIIFLLVGCGSTSSTGQLHQDLDSENNKTTLKEQEQQQQQEVQEPKEFETITFNGSGDDVVEFDLQENAFYLIHVKGNAEGRHFALKAYDETGYYDLLINTSKVYDGKVFDGDFNKNTLEVNAQGEWTIEVLDLTNASTHIEQGQTVTGHGDDVLLVYSYGKTATFKQNGKGHVAVKIYDGRGYYDLAVNESGEYEGKFMLGKNPCIITVESESDWELTLN